MPEFRVKSGFHIKVVEASTAELAAFDVAKISPPDATGKVEVWELKPVETFYIKSTLSLIRKR